MNNNNEKNPLKDIVMILTCKKYVDKSINYQNILQYLKV